MQNIDHTPYAIWWQTSNYYRQCGFLISFKEPFSTAIEPFIRARSAPFILLSVSRIRAQLENICGRISHFTPCVRTLTQQPAHAGHIIYAEHLNLYQ